MRIRYYLTISLLFLMAAFLISFSTLSRLWVEAAHDSTTAESFTTFAEQQPPQDNTPAPPERLEGTPVRIDIPSLKLSVNIADGHYNSRDASWTLSKDKAHYAVMTEKPNNESGNTFIYGHNRRQVFSSLLKLQPGAEAIVHTGNNKQFVYRYRSTYVTSPKDTTLFNYEGSPILTLQTCSGVWYENRSLFTFDLMEVR